MVPGIAICCVAIANISCIPRIRLSGLWDYWFVLFWFFWVFFLHSIMRSGSRSGFYFVNGGLENLERLHPLSIDCAGHSSTTCPHLEKLVLLINIFLKTNDILEHKTAYFPISIHSIFPLQIVCRCMQFMTTKWNHHCNFSGSSILDSAKPESCPTHLDLQNLCSPYHHTILNWADISTFITFCEVGK